MHMAICIEENIIWLDVPVNDVVSVDIPQGAGQFSNPEANSLLGECFSGNVKSQISAAHEVDNQIPIACVSLDFGRTPSSGARRTCIRYLGSCSASCK